MVRRVDLGNVVRRRLDQEIISFCRTWRVYPMQTLSRKTCRSFDGGPPLSGSHGRQNVGIESVPHALASVATTRIVSFPPALPTAPDAFGRPGRTGLAAAARAVFHQVTANHVPLRSCLSSCPCLPRAWSPCRSSRRSDWTGLRERRPSFRPGSGR